ncbi:MAG: hypothetical protein WAT79_06645 [Saprospiraceae bacterium]
MYFVFLLVPATSQKNFDKFIEDLETTEEFIHWRISEKAIKSGIKLGVSKTEIESNLNRISDKILSAHHYMTEINDMEEQKIARILEGHKKKIIKNDAYAEWFQSTDNNETISVLALETKTMIKKVVVLYHKKFQIQVFEFSTHIDKISFERLGWNRAYKRI